MTSTQSGGPTIIKMYIGTYTDTGQRTFYVEWSDGSRTEGPMPVASVHMMALFDRGLDEGAPFSYETW